MWTRILTAALGAPLLLALIVFGPEWGFPLFTVVLVALGLWEFSKMTRPGASLPVSLLGIALGTGLSAAWIFLGEPRVVLALATLGSLGLVIAHFVEAGEMDKAGPRLQASLAGLLFCALPLTHLGLLYSLKPGWRIVLLVLAFTFASDTGAYFTGKAIGKHRFAPRISPKKTWQGSIGGVLAAVLVCQAWARWVMPELSVLDAVILGVGAGFLGQLGDLGESLIKRSAGVKDSGRILPGHGGVLDRFDAVSFSAPLVYYYYLFFVKPGASLFDWLGLSS